MNKSTINNIIKLNIIQNARNLGWTVVIKDINKYILTKKISDINENELNNSNLMLDNLLNVSRYRGQFINIIVKNE